MSIKYTDEELIRILNRYAKQLGRTPTTCDILTLGGPSRNAYYRHFGYRWSDVVKSAGLPPIERKSIHKKYIYRDIPSKEEVVDAFTSFIDEYGYMPYKMDYPDLYRAVKRLFKSDTEIIEACGFDSAVILANTLAERNRRIHTPVESNICKAVRNATPGSGYTCEFIRKYMKGEFD